jgi:hypothetical protein
MIAARAWFCLLLLPGSGLALAQDFGREKRWADEVDDTFMREQEAR